MDGRVFTRQLTSWLDPWRLGWLAVEYGRDPGSLERRGVATRQAQSFRRAGDVGLDRLIRTFLEHFELSSDALAILSGASQVRLPEVGLRRLTGLKFTGDTDFKNLDGPSPENTVVSFAGPTIEILAIAGPVNFLVRLVDQIAGMWSPLERGRAHYEPSFHSELPIYIEATVARALGFLVDAAYTSGKRGVNLRPTHRIVTMVGSPPFDRRASVDSWSVWRRAPLPAPRDASDSGVEAAFEDRDSFVLLDPADAAEPWRNIEHFRNECSPYSAVDAPAPRTDGKLLVDSQYGRAFDFVLGETAAVYGLTEELARISPPAPLGYLRAPYRCVPRLRVHSRVEVETIVATVRDQVVGGLVGNRLLLRGQTEEYYLKRSPSALRALYGDAGALEPSLPASTTRKQQPLEEVLPEWCFLIRSYMVGLGIAMTQQGDPSRLEQLSQVMYADRQRLEESLDNHSFALSLAQHYGLPSMGLDLTDQVPIALFFARRKLQRAADRTLRAVSPASGEPVLYLFAMPERFCLEHARARPTFFPRGRPDTQNAWFSHMGWGLRRNQCAEYLVVALYLDPDGDFGTLQDAQELFPTPQSDSFGSMIEVVLAQDWASPRLKEYVQQLYWLEHR